MRSVVVTGASTGIGWATVKVLLGRGYRVFGAVRKQADADRLKQEFGANFVRLLFDVTDAAEVQRGADKVATILGNETLAGLVNNAGIAVPGPLLHLPVEDFRRQIDVNLTGQLIVTQAFAPLLGADRARQGPKGRIVMISSVGGRRAFPFMGPYHASKFALEGLSESLRRELMLYGIDVIIVAPGAVVTPIWDKAEALDTGPYQATPFGPALGKVREIMLASGRKGLRPERIGLTVAEALEAARPKVRYEVAPDPLQAWALRVAPKRLMDRMIARTLGLRS